LNDHPTDRWRQVLSDFNEPLHKFIDVFQEYTHIPDFVYKVAATFGKKYYRNREYVQEC